MEEKVDCLVPEIHLRLIKEIEDFKLEELSEATPRQIPDGVLYSYHGALPSFLESETEYGRRWVSFVRYGSEALERPLPEGIEFGSTYVNWQGRSYKQTEGGYGKERKWEEVEAPAEASTASG